MKNAWTIALRDYKTYFTSASAYIVMACFHVPMGFYFYIYLRMFQEQGSRMMQGGKGPTLVEGIIHPSFFNMNVFLMMLLPFITMRLFAEERKLHTLELLITAPVTLWEIVLGKFVSSMLFVMTMLSITLFYPLILLLNGNPEIGHIFTTYLGVLLMAGSFLAIGVLCSSFTENQLIAAVTTWMISIFFWIVGWTSQMLGPVWSEIVNYISLITHYNNFAQGILNTSDVLFYISFIFVALFLTHRVLDSYRWR